MSQPLLSILIPTVVGRETELERLIHRLQETYSGTDVEINYLRDSKEMTIGEKRERLYQQANGLFSWQIDDDDDISDDAIPLIIKVIQDTEEVFPLDCITFRESVTINGKYYTSNHHLSYKKWRDNYDGFDFTRSPFYKDVIRTSIARAVPFPKIRWNEDEQWSMALLPHLNVAHYIDKELYIYQHDSKPEEFNERYGIQ